VFLEIEQLIAENNQLVKEIDSLYEDSGIDYLDRAKILKPKYERYQELQAIIKLDRQMTKQKEINQIRGFVTTHKAEILNIFNNKCEVCGFSFKPILVVHHIKPISEGGDNSLNNLSVLCPNCHALAHTHMRTRGEGWQIDWDKQAEFSKWADDSITPNQSKKIIEVSYGLERGVL